jgi:hypothetical protein
MLPNGQALYAGRGKVKYCGQYSCSEPIADAERYSPLATGSLKRRSRAKSCARWSSGGSEVCQRPHGPQVFDHG